MFTIAGSEGKKGPKVTGVILSEGQRERLKQIGGGEYGSLSKAIRYAVQNLIDKADRVERKELAK